MSAMADTAMDWQAEAIDLKRQGVESKDIAEAVGKSAATVRKAIAKARERGDLPEDPLVSALSIEPGEQPANDVPPSDPYPGQTTVDDFTDPLEAFKEQAGDAVGEMQPRPGEEPAGALDVDETPVPVLKGTVQLALDFGPNAAAVTSATVVFKSEKLASGYFEMGDLLHGSFTARVVGVAGAEKFDKDMGDFVAKPQAHTALITEIEIEAVSDDA